MPTEKCSMDILMQLLLQIPQTAQFITVQQLFKTTASITEWLKTHWGTRTHGARQAWARLVSFIGWTVHSPLVLSTQRSPQHPSMARASLPGREPKRSWELGQVCVIGNKKIPTNNIVLGLSMRCPSYFQ